MECEIVEVRVRCDWRYGGIESGCVFIIYIVGFFGCFRDVDVLLGCMCFIGGGEKYIFERISL